MRRPRPHKFIEVWVLFYLWLKPSESSTVRLNPSFTRLSLLNLLGLFLVSSVAHRRYPSTTRDIDGWGSSWLLCLIPLDHLDYGVMMNGRSNSSAETRVTVRVPEDEKSWYGGQWCDPHHHCDSDVLAL